MYNILHMKVAIVSGATRSSDSVRGIGVHNSELFKAFREGSKKDIDILEVGSNDDLSKFDVVHFTSFRPFFRSLPFNKPKNTKFILTIHDLIPLLYPKIYKPGIRGLINYYLNKFLVKRHVDAIITISETSKKDIVRFLKFNPQNVHVVYLGSKSAYFKLKPGKWQSETEKRFNLKDNFVVYFGDINYNKNIPTLLKACKLAKIQLVLVGKQALEIEKMNLNHPENVHLKYIYKDLISSKNIIRTGFISDEDANKLLNLATCLIQPSFYEGFGLSVIHAFASGCPVIASKTQALVEIGGEACLYFDPYNVYELVEKIKLLNNNLKLRNEYLKKGLEQVKKYSWKKTAKETLEVYAKCI